MNLALISKFYLVQSVTGNRLMFFFRKIGRSWREKEREREMFLFSIPSFPVDYPKLHGLLPELLSHGCPSPGCVLGHGIDGKKQDQFIRLRRWLTLLSLLLLFLQCYWLAAQILVLEEHGVQTHLSPDLIVLSHKGKSISADVCHIIYLMQMFFFLLKCFDGFIDLLFSFSLWKYKQPGRTDIKKDLTWI